MHVVYGTRVRPVSVVDPGAERRAGGPAEASQQGKRSITRVTDKRDNKLQNNTQGQGVPNHDGRPSPSWKKVKDSVHKTSGGDAVRDVRSRCARLRARKSCVQRAYMSAYGCHRLRWPPTLRVRGRVGVSSAEGSVRSGVSEDPAPGAARSGARAPASRDPRARVDVRER